MRNRNRNGSGARAPGERRIGDEVIDEVSDAIGVVLQKYSDSADKAHAIGRELLDEVDRWRALLDDMQSQRDAWREMATTGQELLRQFATPQPPEPKPRLLKSVPNDGDPPAA